LPVVDASALVHYLLGSDIGRKVEERLRDSRSIDAPHVIDLEVASALRRLDVVGAVRPHRAQEALEDLLRLPLVRCPARALLPRIWELRRTLTSYDASYVALAEALSAPLVTADGRLARSHGHRAEIDLVR
jgi:predicted nucleic acid-binding protein